ncbi:unnamed protein product [Polarella glacialis]|uniref:Uncharacterized protein n=1 Tax=Polarella glacialis TaxID=89957 RepID=A0A813IMU3_POLGL|nr:unnamed protein product [Polarella glacialis]
MAAENDLANSKKAKKDKKSKKDKKDKKHKKADADSSGEPLPGEDAFDEEVRRLLEDDDDDAPAAVPVDALSSKQSPGAEVQKEQPPLEKIEHSSEDPLSKRPRTGDSPSDVNSSGTASKTEAVGAEETSFWDALHTKVSGGSVEGGSGLVPLQHEAGQPEAASSEFGVSAAHAALLARKMERIMSISGAKLSLRRNRLSIAGGPASVPALRYARAVVDRKVTAIDSVDDMSLVFVSLDWADTWTGQDVVEREEGVLIVPKVVQSSSSSSRSSFSPGDLVEFQSPETKIWSMATVMSRVASRRLRLRFSRDHVEQEVEDCLIRAAAVIAIFGDCRQRLAAEARILADFDSKSTGALAAWLQSPSRCARRLGSSGGSLPVRQETLWRLEKSPFPAQLLQATGCLAARFFLWPPVRPSSASGKVTQALPYVLFAGTQEQRWQALQILSTFAAGMDSRKHQSLPACLTGDCRTVSMPKGVLPVLMGKQMSGILQLMKSTRTFIFPLKEEDEKGADKDMDDMLEMMLDDKVLEGSCEVAIFGQPRARIGAELKIMALIEHERPGWITDKGGSSANAINTSEGFAIDRIEAERPLEAEPAAVGEPSQGELLAAASGCLVESAGRLVFLAGRPVERARAREYLAWVVAGRQSRISKLKSRADAVMLRAPQKVADFPWLTVQLARVGRETGTIAFFDGDSGGSDEAAWQRLIFAGRPLSSGGGLSAGLLQQASALLKKAVLYKDSGLEPTAVPGARAEVELEKKEEDDEDGEDSKGKGKGKDKGKGKGFKGKGDSSETKGKGKGKDDDQTKDDKGKGKGDKGKGKDDKGKGKGKMAFRDGSHLQFLQPPTPGMPVPGPGTPGAAPGAVGGSSLPSAAAKRGFAADGLVAPETPLPPGRAAAVAEVAPPAAFDFPEAMPATPAAVAPVPSLVGHALEGCTSTQRSIGRNQQGPGTSPCEQRASSEKSGGHSDRCSAACVGQGGFLWIQSQPCSGSGDYDFWTSDSRASQISDAATDTLTRDVSSATPNASWSIQGACSADTCYRTSTSTNTSNTFEQCHPTAADPGISRNAATSSGSGARATDAGNLAAIHYLPKLLSGFQTDGSKFDSHQSHLGFPHVNKNISEKTCGKRVLVKEESCRRASGNEADADNKGRARAADARALGARLLISDSLRPFAPFVGSAPPAFAAVAPPPGPRNTQLAVYFQADARISWSRSRHSWASDARLSKYEATTQVKRTDDETDNKGEAQKT